MTLEILTFFIIGASLFIAGAIGDVRNRLDKIQKELKDGNKRN